MFINIISNSIVIVSVLQINITITTAGIKTSFSEWQVLFSEGYKNLNELHEGKITSTIPEEIASPKYLVGKIYMPVTHQYPPFAKSYFLAAAVGSSLHYGKTEAERSEQ